MKNKSLLDIMGVGVFLKFLRAFLPVVLKYAGLS
jgi:hypothetical protein